jgi:CheY-like chemotaxis protein
LTTSASISFLTNRSLEVLSKNTDIDIVLMDNMMKWMDLRSLKNKGKCKWKNLPIICLTGKTEKDREEI